MQIVHIADNPLELSSWRTYEVDNVHDLLKSVFHTFPPTCRIYHDSVAISNDVTPVGEASATALGSYDELYVVVYPAWAQVAAAVLVYAVAWVVTQLTHEKAAKPREQTFANGSPNNSLSDRSNRARFMERVPDMYGNVRSVPDKIMWTYTVYENHRPVEYSWLCVGRGKYSVNDVREGDTPYAQISDSSVVVYPPNQTPGGGTPSLVIGDMITEKVYSVYPVQAVNGQSLPPINSFYCYGSGLNADILQKFDKWIDAAFMRLTSSTGAIVLPTNNDPDYVRSRIQVGDELQVIWGVLGAGGGGAIPDLSAGLTFGLNPALFTPGVGIPPIRADLEPLTVTSLINRGDSQVEVRVTIPASLQAQWAKIVSPYTPFVDVLNSVPVILNKNCSVCAQNRWAVGYKKGVANGIVDKGIFIDDPDQQEIWLNFVAERGLYLEDGANRKVLRETIQWQVTPCDSSGVATGAAENGTVVLEGSLIGGETRAITFKFNPSFTGRCLLVVARTSLRARQVNLEFDAANPLDPTKTVTFYFNTATFNLNADLTGDGPDGDPFPRTAFTGTITDDIKFANCYSMSVPTTVLNAPVTTIHSRVVANDQATSVQDRQLNCVALRFTGSWNGSIWQPLVADSQDFAENILFEMMIDPFIGNRLLGEIDFAGIANAAAAVRAYFADEDATRFSYTFDDHNMSFEETIMVVCRAIFLTPYRQANVIKCDPDIATDNSVVLFNHRNKSPGTEIRTESFGMLNDNDGVEQQYVDINTGIGNVQPISQFLSQTTVVAPLQSRIVGIRFRWQAWWHAYRQLYRLIHQNLSIEFDAAVEAGLVGINQRILVEDNTRPDVQDGEVIGVSGLVLKTSQQVSVVALSTYTVFLQQPDGTVQGIACTPASPDSYSITLSGAPANPVITDPNFGTPTTYILVRDQNTVGKAFLVTDKSAKDRMVFTMQAVNYQHMYYQADGLSLYIIPSTEIGNEEFFDRGPYERTNLANITMLGSDAVWGPVYDSNVGFLTNSNFGAHLTNYTKTCWVKVDSGTSGSILSTQGGNQELFSISSSNLIAGHNGTTSVSSAVTGGITIWHHYAVTYTSTGGAMKLYIDGEQVASATGVATRILSALSAFNGTTNGALDCKAKFLRHYARVLSPNMVREMYQKELIQP